MSDKAPDAPDAPDTPDVMEGPLGQAFGWAYEILSLAPGLTREAVDLIVTDLGTNGDDVSTLCCARVDSALEACNDESLDGLDADDATRARRNALAWLWLEALVTGLKHGRDGQVIVNVHHHIGKTEALAEALAAAVERASPEAT